MLVSHNEHGQDGACGQQGGAFACSGDSVEPFRNRESFLDQPAVTRIVGLLLTRHDGTIETVRGHDRMKQAVLKGQAHLGHQDGVVGGTNAGYDNRTSVRSWIPDTTLELDLNFLYGDADVLSSQQNVGDFDVLGGHELTVGQIYHVWKGVTNKGEWGPS